MPASMTCRSPRPTGGIADREPPAQPCKAPRQAAPELERTVVAALQGLALEQGKRRGMAAERRENLGQGRQQGSIVDDRHARGRAAQQRPGETGLPGDLLETAVQFEVLHIMEEVDAG